MNISRRTVLSGAGALALGAAFHTRAQAAEFTYKFGNVFPATHPFNVRFQAAADAIFEETSGRLKINVFPSSQLGKDTEMMSQIRAGATELYAASPIVLSTLAPNAAISGMAFAFPDYDTVWSAMDGKLGAYSRSEIEKKGLVTMPAMWDNGFRQMTSAARPINGPDDLAGFKMRVPAGPLWQSMFQAFGSAPTTINGAEMYTALSTGIVDGQENPLAILSTFKLFEVQKFCSMTNHIWDGVWIVANKNAWEALPENVREIVDRHLGTQALLQRQDIAQSNDTLRAELTQLGMTFNEPESAPFRKKLSEAGFYKEWREKFGDEAWATLEESVGASLG